MTHSFPTRRSSDLGDAVSKTDGKIYDPALKLYEVKGDRSGTLDDRWAFTSKSSARNYGSIAGLAAAARALKGFDDGLASKALGIETRTWAEEQGHAPDLYSHGKPKGGPLEDGRFVAAGERLTANISVESSIGKGRVR